MFQVDVFGDPLVNIAFGAYSTGGGGAEVIGDRIYQTRANLTIMRGKHSLKIGGQDHDRKFYTNTGNPMDGNATFDGGITGFPMADALLGYPSEIRRGQGNTLTDGIGHFFLGYAQDDWRVSKNLTVNLGLMYQMGTRPMTRRTVWVTSGCTRCER
jgi:outer membrane receptor protein involved in Fe transport